MIVVQVTIVVTKICNAAAAALCLDDADGDDGDDEEKMKLNFRQANFHKSGVITKVDKLIAPRLIFCWFFLVGCSFETIFESNGGEIRTCIVGLDKRERTRELILICCKHEQKSDQSY